jgi:hypothetical protein
MKTVTVFEKKLAFIRFTGEIIPIGGYAAVTAATFAAQ